MQKIEELEAENCRLDEQSKGSSALYVPKIQELEASLGESQRELSQAQGDQEMILQDNADKASCCGPTPMSFMEASSSRGVSSCYRSFHARRCTRSCFVNWNFGWSSGRSARLFTRSLQHRPRPSKI